MCSKEEWHAAKEEGNDLEDVLPSMAWLVNGESSETLWWHHTLASVSL